MWNISKNNTLTFLFLLNFRCLCSNLHSPLLYECLFRSIIFYCVTSFVHKTKFVDNYNYTENTIILKYNITVVARVQFLLLYNWTLCFTERLLRSIYILVTFRDWVYIYWHFVKHSHYISIQQFQLNQGIQFWWDYQRSKRPVRGAPQKVPLRSGLLPLF